MSIKGAQSRRPQPKPWSKAAKQLIQNVGRSEFASALGTTPGYISSMHTGAMVTSAAMVDKVAMFALGRGLCLTPADMGRRDLVLSWDALRHADGKKGGEG